MSFDYDDRAVGCSLTDFHDFLIVRVVVCSESGLIGRKLNHHVALIGFAFDNLTLAATDNEPGTKTLQDRCVLFRRILYTPRDRGP